MYDPSKPLWSIFIGTHSGKTDIRRHLTLEQVTDLYKNIWPEYGCWKRQLMVHPDLEKDGECTIFTGSPWTVISPDDVERIEIFGPEDWDESTIQCWPKYYNIYIDESGKTLPEEMQTSPSYKEYKEYKEYHK